MCQALRNHRNGRTRQWVIPILTFGLCLFQGTSSQQTSVPAYLNAVVKIYSSECRSTRNIVLRKNGSGFVWRKASSIVTSLHVVAGCRDIGVSYLNGAYSLATISRVHKRADLALLEVQDPPNVTPLVESQPKLGSQTVGWGYPHVSEGLEDKGIRLQARWRSISDIVKASGLLDAIKRVGVPSVNTELLGVDGHVLPGQSGGPILDEARGVVGIIDGGLEGGGVEINWAIPSTYLADLLRSQEGIPADDLGLHAFFASSVSQEAQPQGSRQQLKFRPGLTSATSTIECGDIELARVKTRTLEQLSQFSDDPAGLMQVEAAIKALRVNLDPSDTFDLYQDLESGATVLVPSDADIESFPGYCVATLGSGRVRQYFRVQRSANSPAQIQADSLKFESDIAMLLGQGTWQLNPQLTYPTPRTRFDGLTVRRLGYIQHMPTAQGFEVAKYAVETLAARSSVFLGVMSVRLSLSNQRLALENLCYHQPQTFGCDDIREEVYEVAQMWLAMHLSTFAIG